MVNCGKQFWFLFPFLFNLKKRNITPPWTPTSLPTSLPLHFLFLRLSFSLTIPFSFFSHAGTSAPCGSGRFSTSPIVSAVSFSLSFPFSSPSISILYFFLSFYSSFSSFLYHFIIIIIFRCICLTCAFVFCFRFLATHVCPYLLDCD